MYSTTLYLSTHPHSHCTICLRPSAVVMACGQRQNLVRIAYRDLATALPGHTPRRMVQLRSSLNLKQLSTCTYCRSEPLLPEINRAAEQQKTFEGFPLFFSSLKASCQLHAYIHHHWRFFSQANMFAQFTTSPNRVPYFQKFFQVSWISRCSIFLSYC